MSFTDYTSITGGLLSEESKNYFVINDNVGNITSVIDKQGNIINSYAYSPFGELIVEQEQVKLNIGFNTKYEDESGLIYYNNRYYDSELGRFISQDPIFEEGGINLYNFVENDPINSYDVLGEFPVSFTFRAYIPGNNPNITYDRIMDLPDNLQNYNWLDEPVSVNRSFNTGDKITLNANFDSSRIGSLNNPFSIDIGSSIRVITRDNDILRGEFDDALYYVETSPSERAARGLTQPVISSSSEGSVAEGGRWTSVIEVSAFGTYPYSWAPNITTPSIDIDFTLSLAREISYEPTECPSGSLFGGCRNRIETVSYTLSGSHNIFPNYEILTFGSNDNYEYITASSRPSIVSLTSSNDFSISGSQTNTTFILNL